MTSKIVYRSYEAGDLEQILALSRRSDSTSRTILSWRGNDMTAICAFAGKRLIGAIPFERRSLALGGSLYIKVLWATGVHVDEDFRSVGIGEAMDLLIARHFGDKTSGIFVYRGNKNSGAYRWYEKVGFSLIATIEALSKQVDQSPRRDVVSEVYSGEDMFSMIGDELYNIFVGENEKRSGFQLRSPGYWNKICKFHLYRSFYKYFVLTIGQGDLKAYAFVGQTSIGDTVDRLDIFEFIGPPESWENLSEAIRMFALDRGVHTLRFRTYMGSEIGEWLRKTGFILEGKFYFMGKPFEKESVLFSTNKVAPFSLEPNQIDFKKSHSLASPRILSNFSQKGAYFHSDYA